MKRILAYLLVGLLAAAPVAQTQAAQTTDDWQVYEGAVLEVLRPTGTSHITLKLRSDWSAYTMDETFVFKPDTTSGYLPSVAGIAPGDRVRVWAKPEVWLKQSAAYCILLDPESASPCGFYRATDVRTEGERIAFLTADGSLRVAVDAEDVRGDADALVEGCACFVWYEVTAEGTPAEATAFGVRVLYGPETFE